MRHPCRILATRRDLTPRNPSLDRRPAQTPVSRGSWWAEPQTREEWMKRADERARELNAVSTTQHVQRREGDA